MSDIELKAMNEDVVINKIQLRYDVLEYLQKHCEPITPNDLYSNVFGRDLEYIDDRGRTQRYNGIIRMMKDNPNYDQIDENGKKDTRKMISAGYRILYDGLDGLNDCLKSDYFCICSLITYVGKSRSANNARFCYGFIIEVDELRKNGKGIEMLFGHMLERPGLNRGYIPEPTYIIWSGRGVHLYYVFDEPVAMFPEKVAELTKLRNALAKRIWSSWITDKSDDIEYESIFQGFRVPGTVTKDRITRAEAFKYKTAEKVTIDYLNEFVPEDKRACIYGKVKNIKKTPLNEAKKKWPEWYENRIVKGKPRKKPGDYTVKRDLYDWWKRTIDPDLTNNVKVGHRGYCLLALVAFGLKCDIDPDEIREDCEELQPKFNALAFKPNKDGDMSINEEDLFLEDEIDTAMRLYDSQAVNPRHFTRNHIEKCCGFELPKNKRNGLKQADHLEIARAIQTIKDKQKGTNWRDNNGRPSAEQTVKLWRKEHPNGTKKQCKDETGLTYPTIRKWWNFLDSNN